MKNIQDIVNTKRCIGCAACFSACVKGYIEYKADGGMGFPVPSVIQCDGCGNCLRSCPLSGELGIHTESGGSANQINVKIAT
jgi:Fe-S-cluster-containing hydrogenase component 2